MRLKHLTRPAPVQVLGRLLAQGTAPVPGAGAGAAEPVPVEALPALLAGALRRLGLAPALPAGLAALLETIW